MNTPDQQPAEKTTNRPNHTRQYALIALVLILLSIGVALVYRGCTPKQPIAVADDSDRYDDDVAMYEDEPEPETLDDIINIQEENDENEASSNTEVASEDAGEIESVPSMNESPSAANRKSIKEDDPRRYMVIAGSFSSIDNARRHMERIIIAGSINAEIVQFDGSNLHTVCAFRTDDESDARAVIAELKAKKINAFLHAKK